MTAYTSVSDDLRPDMLHRFTAHLAEKPPFRCGDFATAAVWLARASELRGQVREALGFHLYESCDLDAKVMGALEYEDYHVEKVLFYSQPAVPVTANLYLPSRLECPVPAVLHPHGHWGFGKAGEAVQARSIWLARHGFISLTLDTWGCGERAEVGHRNEEALCLVGASTAGLETWDNSRALDYLCSRPEVDTKRLACTGCSGGGEQTVLLVAVDERLAAAAAVCYPVTWHSHYSTTVSHCQCNFVPGMYRHADIPELLALFAPKPMLHVTALRDGTFLPAGARACYERASAYWQLLGQPANICYVEVDDEHGYSQPMREVMYGWFMHHLAGEADCGSLREEAITTEPEASRRLWVLPHGLPEATLTAARLGRKLALRLERPEHGPEVLRSEIRDRILGGFPDAPTPTPIVLEEAQSSQSFRLTRLLYATEDGIAVPALVLRGAVRSRPGPGLLFLPSDRKETAQTDPVVKSLLEWGWTVLAPDLRGRGETHWPPDVSRGSDEYTTFARSLHLGRPLLGQRVWDAVQSLAVLAAQPGVDPAHLACFGDSVSGLVALFAAALDPRVAAVATWGALGTYIAEEPGVFSYEVPFSSFLPSILEVADLPQVAALVAPRPLLVASAVGSLNRPVPGLARLYEPTRQAYMTAGAAEAFDFYPADQNARTDLISGWLKRWLAPDERSA